ncbi:21511_t:CDS:1, partial [Gigaspora rosea]
MYDTVPPISYSRSKYNLQEKRLVNKRRLKNKSKKETRSFPYTTLRKLQSQRNESLLPQYQIANSQARRDHMFLIE